MKVENSMTFITRDIGRICLYSVSSDENSIAVALGAKIYISKALVAPVAGILRAVILIIASWLFVFKYCVEVARS